MKDIDDLIRRAKDQADSTTDIILSIEAQHGKRTASVTVIAARLVTTHLALEMAAKGHGVSDELLSTISTRHVDAMFDLFKLAAAVSDPPITSKKAASDLNDIFLEALDRAGKALVVLVKKED